MKKLLGGVLSAATLFCVLTPGTAAAAVTCEAGPTSASGGYAICWGNKYPHYVRLDCVLVGPPSGANPAQKYVDGPGMPSGQASYADCGWSYQRRGQEARY